jgi:hypothetical protein
MEQKQKASSVSEMMEFLISIIEFLVSILEVFFD